MKSRTFAFYSRTEFEHAFDIEAASPEEAFEAALRQFQPAEGSGAYIVDYFSTELTEKAPDKSGRTWSLDDDGEVVEQAV